MDFKNVRSDFIVALWVALLLYLASMTYLMADIESRLGHIEHYLAHQGYAGGSESAYGVLGK
jgi:hypothetical protein